MFLKNVFMENLPRILETAKLPKNMKWSEGNVVFSRPVRNILAMLSGKLLPITVFGLPSTDSTFINLTGLATTKIKTSVFNTYKNIMKKNHIYIEQDERKKVIMDELIKAKQGLSYKEDDLHLLEQWIYECENPSVALVDFDLQYLQLPNIFVEHILKNKLYLLPLYELNNNLVNKAAFCVNKLESLEEVTKGLKDVISARLEDLRFYWQNDLNNDTQNLKGRLSNVVFPRSVGSMNHKLQKISTLYHILSTFLPEDKIVSKESIEKILEYFKLDYVTQTFAEYPELEGYIIFELLRYKMKADKTYDDKFFSAILESYKPRTTNDTISQCRESLYVSFLDKLDDMVSFILNGFKPKAQEDPFFIKKKTALVMYTLHSSFLNTLPIKNFFKEVVKFYGDFYKKLIIAGELKAYNKEFLKSLDDVEKWFKEIWQYFVDRYRNFLLERGYKESIVNIVLQSNWNTFKDVKCGIEAIDMMEGLPFWQSLFEVINRTKKIISDESKNYLFKEELLQHPEEKELYKIHKEFYAKWKDKKLVNTNDRLEFAKEFTQTYSDVLHNFFEKVFVEVKDKDLQLNRKNLLYQINKFFVNMIADISLLIQKGGQL